MFKHECVECIRKHYFKCMFDISFIDRLLGSIEVKNCPTYRMMVKNKK